jgi:hypothetical protein
MTDYPSQRRRNFKSALLCKSSPYSALAGPCGPAKSIKKEVFVMGMLPEFGERSFWPGIESDALQKPATFGGIVREGLRKIVTCALEPLFPADVLTHRK